MAKRFTDTDKWKRDWFLDLEPKAKLVWFFLLDQCDHRGVWVASFRLMSSLVGQKITREEFENWFENKVVLIDQDKYFIPSFYKFQYGELNGNNRAHLGVIKLLQKLRTLDGPNKDLPSPKLGGKDKDKEYFEKGVVGEKTFKPDLDAIYEKYPKKEGKQKGLTKLKAQIRTQKDYEDLCLALDRYVQHCRDKRTEHRFIKMFSTWVSDWRDWLDENHGKSADFSEQNQVRKYSDL